MRIGETAKLLGVSTGTIRNYLKLGNQYFSPDALRKKGKNFYSWDIDQLQEIRRNLANGVSFDEVHNKLTPIPDMIELEEPEPYIPVPDSRDSAIELRTIQEQFRKEREEIKAAYERTLSAKDEYIAELKADKKRLQAELDRIKYKAVPTNKNKKKAKKKAPPKSKKRKKSKQKKKKKKR